MNGLSDLWLAAVIGAVCIMALARLALWRRRAAAGHGGPQWRFPALAGLNLLAALFLYLTLNPPDVGVRAGRLVVLTAGAPSTVETQAGDVLVALAEAGTGAGERVPDLATALRRHPEVRAVRLVGAGLTARDRLAVDRPILFEAPPLPEGFVQLTPPEPVAAGAPFTVSGAVGALPAGIVELVDPSGAVVDRARVTTDSRFILRGSARAAGLTQFDLRLKNAEGAVIERIDIPLEARDPSPPRVIVMAGAPGPEPRFLRRWAQGAGIDLSVQLSLGAGVELTARPAPLTLAGLSETDLLVIDERRWDGLGGGEKAVVRTAVAGGMGLLLRPTGPLSEATRREWAALGAPLSGGETVRPLALEGPTAPADEASQTDQEAPPELTRRDFAVSPSAAVLLTDADGTALATWRPYGSGRVGVWTVADSYALMLTGREDVYGALWSRMFSTLARPEGGPAPKLSGIVRAGQRATVCGLQDGAVMTGPDGGRARLLIDPRAGPTACAAFWPLRSGWHAVTGDGGERGVVFVHPADATPSLIAAELRDATLALAGEARSSSSAGPGRAASSPWPFSIGLLAALAALWWLERRRPNAVSQSGDPRLS